MNKAGKIILEILLIGSILGLAPSLYGEKRKLLKKDYVNEKNYVNALKRVNNEVSRVISKSALTKPAQREPIYSPNDLTSRVFNKEKIVFSQNLDGRKDKIETKVGFNLNRRRDLECITTDISYQGFKVQTNYNAQRKQHTIKGSGTIAGFNANLVLDNTKKPALSASRIIKIADISITPSSSYDLESKNLGLGLAGSINKYFGASFSINNSPIMNIIDYTISGNISNTVNIKLHGRETSRPGNPDSARKTYDVKTTTKLNKHTTFKAGLNYINSEIKNPCVSITYSRKF